MSNGEFAFMAMVILVFGSLFGWGIHKGSQEQGEATICAEIDWHSPTCQQIKEARLKP